MAAAYATLVSLFNDLEDIQNHPRHSFSLDNNQIQSLVQCVTFLIEFMESYDNCLGPTKDVAQLLERRITCAAHAAEEVIQSHVVNQICSGTTLDAKTRSPRFLLDLEKVIQDMDYVRRKAIKVQQARSGLELKQPTYSTPVSSSTPLTSEKTTMVGFDNLLLQLLDLLTGYPSSRRVVPIVGTGGIGKTTLARYAFEHSLIEQHFDVCLWATISQQYVVQDVLFTLLSGKGESNSGNVVQLGEQLHKRLYGRRYLIVLDDMWSVRAWDEMKNLFPDTSNGSRIVVTTRQTYVADHIGSSRLAISLLDDDKSWDLFCQKTFVGQGCPLELEDVGKNIVKKCKGLPLAIVVISGHLGKSPRKQEYWETVANNINSILNSKENKQFLGILSFSYINLPVHLKPCFIYMGTFQEDSEIFVSDLINRWIADGLLKMCKAKSLEEIAHDYLKDLIDRNLVIDCTRKANNYSSCKLHDILRDLCLQVAKNEMFFYVVDTPRADDFGLAICREHQVGVKEKNVEETHHPEIFHVPKRLHLVRYLQGSIRGELTFDLRLCRAMNMYMGALTSEGGGGFLEDYLQYLNLRYLKYFKVCGMDDLYPFLRSSMSLFWNLQTLIIDGFYSSIIAPNEIWEMVQLRHLGVRCGIQLPDPLPVDKLNQAHDYKLVLQNLHTLLVVENFKFIEDVCIRVPNIKELEVKYSYYGRNCDQTRIYYSPHNLGCLRKLELLALDILDGNRDSGWREFSLSLTFPSSLKKLSLRNTFLDWEEMTMMVGSLPHLETLNLECNSVVGSEWTLVEGKFISMKSLTISFCDDLVNWNVDSTHFPVLEDLELKSVPRLDEFPSDIGNIPTLRSIFLWNCSVSSATSAVRMLVEQEEEHGNEGLTLHVVLWGKNLESFNRKVEEEGLTSNNLFVY